MNIIVIMTDQQRRETVSANPGAWIETPNIDSIAKQGTNFQRAYAACPVCVPTRATFMSGLHANRMYTEGFGSPMDNTGNVPDLSKTLPNILKNAGYSTAVCGKTHLRPYGCNLGFEVSHLFENDPDVEYTKYLEENGFDYKDMMHDLGYSGVWEYKCKIPLEYYSSTWVKNKAIDYIRSQNGKDQPFFMWTSFLKPHNPYNPPEPYYGSIDHNTMPAPVKSEKEWSEKGEVYKYRKQFYDQRIENGPPSEEDILKARARYCETVKLIDDGVGEIFSALEETGQADDTAVIFVSDHGDLLGDHHLWHKTCAYEASAGVPMLMKVPGKTGMGQSRALASTIDLMPTCLDLAGLEVPPELQGKSLLRAYDNTPDDWRRNLYIECGYYPSTMTAIVKEYKKYIHYMNGGEEELYDLKNDPDELENLAYKKPHRKLRNKMRAELVELVKKEGPYWCIDGDDLAKIKYTPRHNYYGAHKDKRLTPPGAKQGGVNTVSSYQQ